MGALCLSVFVAINMDWKEELKEFVDNKTVIMGIGSTLKCDDGVGVFIAESLKNSGINNVIVAGATPEHWLGFLTDKKFEKLLIVDSVLFGGEEGEIKLFDLREISENAYSSGMLCRIPGGRNAPADSNGRADD